MNYKIELANLKDIDSILMLYSDRMKWFKDNNIKQWSRYLKNHPKEEFEEAIKNGTFYIIKQNDELVACFEISTNSKYWNDNITPAYYIYKIVTKIGHKNLGKIIFDKCMELAKLNGKKYLRIECLKYNEKLNKIYEQYNFKLVKYGNNERYSYSLRELKLDE